MRFDSKRTSLLDELSLLAEQHGYIDPDLYAKYDVKRGLRDSDGKRCIGRSYRYRKRIRV